MTPSRYRSERWRLLRAASFRRANAKADTMGKGEFFRRRLKAAQRAMVALRKERNAP